MWARKQAKKVNRAEYRLDEWKIEQRDKIANLNDRERKFDREIEQGREAQKQVRQLKKEIKESKDYAIGLLHGALKRLGYDSKEELEKQHEIAQEKEWKRD